MQKHFELSVLPDTGASKSLISLDKVLQHGLDFDHTRRSRIVAANGSNLACEGTVRLSAFNSRTGRSCTLDALISSDSCNDFLLSWTDMIKLGIIAEDFPFSTSEDINSLKNEDKLKTCDVLKLSKINCPRLKNILNSCRVPRTEGSS